jgi:hypothetical protein
VVRALRRGLSTEVEFLRRPSARVPELELTAGRPVGQPGAGRWHYHFETGEGTSARVLDQDATLVSASLTVQASVVELSGTAVVVEVRQLLATSEGWRLVFRPGMLLERLDEALGRCLDDPAFCAETALRSLGVRPSGRLPLGGPPGEAAGLNDSQRGAIARACERNLTSIWGPPGTGKTKVIGLLVAELCRRGERVLLAANTNAAVDNAVEAVRAAGVAVHRMTNRGERPPEETEDQRRLALRKTQAHHCSQLVAHLAEVPRQQSLMFGAVPPLVRPGQLIDFMTNVSFPSTSPVSLSAERATGRCPLGRRGADDVGSDQEGLLLKKDRNGGSRRRLRPPERARVRRRHGEIDVDVNQGCEDAPERKHRLASRQSAGSGRDARPGDVAAARCPELGFRRRHRALVHAAAAALETSNGVAFTHEEAEAPGRERRIRHQRHQRDREPGLETGGSPHNSAYDHGCPEVSVQKDRVAL